MVACEFNGPSPSASMRQALVGRKGREVNYAPVGEETTQRRAIKHGQRARCFFLSHTHNVKVFIELPLS